MIYSKDLDFFLDKPCTIIVREINWRYKVENMVDYFVGFIYRIDEKYIWLRHAINGCINCIDLSQVISISEEQIIKEPLSEDKKITEENKSQLQNNSANNKHVNIKDLISLIKKT